MFRPIPEDYTVFPSFYFNVLPDVASWDILGSNVAVEMLSLHLVVSQVPRILPETHASTFLLGFIFFSSQSFRHHIHMVAWYLLSCVSDWMEKTRRLCPKHARPSLARTLAHSAVTVHTYTSVLWLCPRWNLETNRVRDSGKEATAAKPTLGSPGKGRCKNDLAKSLFFWFMAFPSPPSHSSFLLFAAVTME